MGSSESTLSSSLKGEDGITTVSKRFEGVDPLLEKLRSIRMATPISASESTEVGLTNILVRKPSTSSDSGVVDPKVILELFSMYQERQEKQTDNINKRQEKLENKIKVVFALAIKLLRKYTFSASAMKTTSSHLSGVHLLQADIKELEGRLTEVISSCDGLCKRIVAEGPESLHSSAMLFTASTTSSFSSASKEPPLPL